MFFNKVFITLLANILNPFIGVKKDCWIFSSDKGNLYREGSKYLFEYVNRFHPEIKCVYITRNPKTVDEIRRLGYNAAHNFSWTGLKSILYADKVFFSQGPPDIFFAFKKKNRKFYYLNHGQALKKQMNELSRDYQRKRRGPISEFIKNVGYLILIRFHISDSEFISATSQFTIPFLRKAYGDKMPIKLLGMPRTDALFQQARMDKEKWLNGLNNKFIITYMPTHRLYGKGLPSPTPFHDNETARKWMKENNVVLLVKQHPNMASHVKASEKTDTIIDITKDSFDPQVVIYHTDILISDYSSVWLDYLLLRRPIIHYLYDNFETEDAGLNIDITKDGPGSICRTEEELFNRIRHIKDNYEIDKPSKDCISKFFHDIDGHSCERYYHEIMKE